jgi:hypothetical protein
VTEPERTERTQRYRGPLPGEVPLSRDVRPGGVTPGVGLVPEAPEPALSSGPEPSGAEPAHVPDRPPSRAQRRADDRAMVPLLAQALSSQLGRLAADDEAAQDGWWFTPDR